MKKLLLSLAVLLSAIGVSAAPVTVDFTTAEGLPTSSSATPVDCTVDGIPFTFVNTMKSGYNNSSYLMMYGKSKAGEQQEAYMEFTLGYECTKITIHTSSGASKNVMVQLSANGTNIGNPLKLDALDKDFSFDIPAASQAAGTKYKIATTNKYNSQLTSITFNGEGTVTPPTPQPTTVEVANIAAFLAANNTTDNLKITGATTAVYQNGRYLWIKDNSGVLLTYNGGDIEMPKFVSGQTVEGGITGQFVNFSQGQLQMANLVAGSFKAGQVGFEVEPEVMQVEELASDLVNTYVLLKGVKIVAGEAANTYTVTDASGDITLYNQFNDAQKYDVVEVPTGENLNLYAMVAIHKGNLQLMPVKVTTASGREVVATPTFSVAAGAVAEGTEVAITCATEGATIYYTVDGTAPTAASTVYSAPVKVTEAMTIKALAVKEGMDDSSVATAAYTIKNSDPVVGNVVTFDFTDPSTLTPSYSEADAEPDGTTGNLKVALVKVGDLFTAGCVTISSNAAGTEPRLYLQTKNNDWTFRFFKNSTITIKAGEGNTINKVEFDPQTASYATALGKCTFTGGKYADKVCTANANTSEIVIANPAGEAGATIALKTLIVTLNENAGVSDIEIDANASVEFYNLQGVRMNGDLTPGLYIRRQGNKATKVLVK